ncbi:MAG: hypothetical protein QXG10_02445 [Candidatus Hadarchaeales archaeon]
MEGVQLNFFEDQGGYRPPPAKPRMISGIRAGDRRVRVVGVVSDIKSSELTLDDKSGRIQVIFDDSSTVLGVDVGSKICVIGTPLTVSGKTELRAEIIRKVDGLDLELYDEFMKVLDEIERRGFSC